MRGAIVDLDGTVYVGGTVIDGAAAGIGSLREAGLSLLFFSNNPIRDGDEYVRYLQGKGLDINAGEGLSSGDVTAEMLAEYHPDDRVLCLGDERLQRQLREADLTLTEEPDRCGVLVASWTDEFDYGTMRRALDGASERIPFYGTDPDRTFQGPDGELLPGSGAIIGAVSATVGYEPDAVFGKPSEAAQRVALDRLGVAPTDCLVVGDRLDTDLEMGRRAGMTTVLVLTGVTDRTDVADSPVDPDYVIEDLGEIDTVLAETGGRE